MEDRHKKIIRKCRVNLIKDLSAIDALCDKLFAEGVLTEDMKSTIMEENDRESQARELLDILPRRGKDAFNRFCWSLVDTGQQELANILCPEQEPRIPHKTAEEVPYILRPELAPRNPLVKYKTVEEVPSRYDKSTLQHSLTEPTEAMHSLQFQEKVRPLKVNIKKCNMDELMRNYQSCYHMESERRGKLIIINNYDFSKHNMQRDQECHNLSGTSMQLLFEELKFKVETRNNIDSKKLLDIIKAEKTNDDQYDCFAMVILTHGLDDMIFMTDMEPLKTRNIIDEFDSERCPKLHGKPKLFFIHACPHPTEPNPPNGLDFMSSLLPHSHDHSHKADIFITRATSYDPIKSGEEIKGFWFIQAFVHIMQYHAHNTHLVDMMAKVNDLARKDGLIQFRHTLRKDLFFFPEGSK